MLYEEQTPISEPSLEVYFREQVTDCAKHYRPPPNEDTCWYLSTLLTRFSRSESLFSYADGDTQLRPLALLYKDAVEAASDQERCLLLQQLGDMSLFLGALFPERFVERGIRQDYLIGMGGGAYDYLASNARQHRHVFSELSLMFARLLELLSKACSREATGSDAAVLSLYQRWCATRDPLAKRQLEALGISLGGSSAVH